MRRFIRPVLGDERGISAMEYAVLAGIVVVAVVAAGSLLSDGTSGLPAMFTNLLTTVKATIG